MPITVSYCRNDLRKNDIYITSKSGGRLAPGCSTTVVLDVDVVVYEASGYLDFTWEQIYGPPVTLTYPDPEDLTIALFPYTADGYERKFRFWVNAGVGNVYKRAFYDIIVGDNFYESATVNVEGNFSLNSPSKLLWGIKDRYSRYNLYAKELPQSTGEYSTLTNNTYNLSTLEGQYIKYEGLTTNNLIFTFYPDSYIDSSCVESLPIDDFYYMGELTNISLIGINDIITLNTATSTENTELSTLYSYIPTDSPIINIQPFYNQSILAPELYEPNTLYSYTPEEIITINIYTSSVLSDIIVYTEGAGVIDL